MSYVSTDISSDRAIIAWTVEERWKHYNFQGTSENKKIPIKSILVSNLLEFCQWYENENQVLTPTRAEDDEQVYSELEQLTLITQKTAKRTTSSRRPDATSHRESRNADSKNVRTSIICQSGGTWTIVHYQ